MKKFITIVFLACFIFSGCADKKAIYIPESTPLTHSSKPKEVKKLSEPENLNKNISKEIKITYSKNLTTSTTTIKEWTEFKNSAYSISFEYPSNWKHLIKEYINLDLVEFYDKNNRTIMEIRFFDNEGGDCRRNTKNQLYFKTNDPRTDLYYDENKDPNYANNDYSYLSWERGRDALSWSKNYCLGVENDCGRFKFKFNTKKREESLALFQKIIKSFKFLSKKEMCEIKNSDKHKEQNDKIIKDVKDSPEDFFTNLGQLKFKSISPYQGGPIYHDPNNASIITTVKTIQNALITFAGKAIVSGEYTYGDGYFGDMVCFRENEDQVMPKLNSELFRDKRAHFCLGKSDFVLNQFKIKKDDKEIHGEATIEISSYQKVIYPAGVYSTASLVKVLELR